MASGSPRPTSASGLIRAPKDVLSGLMFIGIGILGLWFGRDFPMGTPVRLGTGVFPFILNWGLIVIGGIVLAQGLLIKGGPVGTWAWRPIIMVSIAATLFAFLIEPAGLVVSMVVLMGLGALAGDDHTIKEFTIFSTIMVIISVTMFIWGLGMPIKVFPWN